MRLRVGTVVTVVVGVIALLPIAAHASTAVKTKKAPCELLTAADVGAPFSDTATQIDDSENTCQWTLSAGGSVFLGITKPDAVSKKDFKVNSKSDTAEKIPGLKKSFYDLGGVTLIKGNSFVNLQYVGSPDDLDAVKDPLITLAKKLVKKL